MLLEDLLRADAGISNIITSLLAANCVCIEGVAGNDLDLVMKANFCASLQSKVASEIEAFTGIAPSLAEVPLQRPTALVRGWLAAVKEFAALCASMLIDTACQQLVSQATEVDGICPRWGDNIGDDGAKVQLLYNDRLATLPDATRKLHSMLACTADVCRALGIAGGVDNPSVREFVRNAHNSLDFAKRTVNVAAATRILFSQAPNPGAVAKMLKFRSQLPLALARRLEELITSTTSDGTGSGSASSARPQSASRAATGALAAKAEAA